jgi:predicted DNA-binding transcriptional regulator AlpA
MATYQWWDAGAVAAFLAVGARQVVERMQFREGFPKPLRVGTARNYVYRWRSDEIAAWAELERQRQDGLERRKKHRRTAAA